MIFCLMRPCVSHPFDWVVIGMSSLRDSLTFKITQQQQQVLGLVQQATPGQVITLNEPLLSVNVILNKETNEYLSITWKYGSLDRSKTTFIICVCFDEQNNNAPTTNGKLAHYKPLLEVLAKLKSTITSSLS